MEEPNKSPQKAYRTAVEAIKTAILQGQYEAAKGVNRIQLAVYFAVGKYISANTRKGTWGTGAVHAISEQLQRELPGLRGFSATSLKKMRLFYENWLTLDANSTVATDDLKKGSLPPANSSVATDELQIDVRHAIRIDNLKDFPVEDFFKIPFTHHVEIFSTVKSLPARYYYIHRTAEENLSVEALKRLIRDDAYGKRGTAPKKNKQYGKNKNGHQEGFVLSLFTDSNPPIKRCR